MQEKTKRFLIKAQLFDMDGGQDKPNLIASFGRGLDHEYPMVELAGLEMEIRDEMMFFLKEETKSA